MAGQVDGWMMITHNAAHYSPHVAISLVKTYWQIGPREHQSKSN